MVHSWQTIPLKIPKRIHYVLYSVFELEFFREPNNTAYTTGDPMATYVILLRLAIRIIFLNWKLYALLNVLLILLINWLGVDLEFFREPNNTAYTTGDPKETYVLLLRLAIRISFLNWKIYALSNVLLILLINWLGFDLKFFREPNNTAYTTGDPKGDLCTFAAFGN
jgi:hypothetical protein